MRNTLVWLALGATACGKTEPAPTPATAVATSAADDVAAPETALAADSAQASADVQAPADAQAAAPMLFRGAIEVGGDIVLKAEIALTGATGTINIPMQRIKGGALSDVVVTPDSVSFLFSPPGAPEDVKVKFSAKKEGDIFVGEIEQPGGKFPLKLTPVASRDDFTAKRPQTPQPPFPYKNELMQVTSGAIALACTLSLPEGAGPFPAVIMFNGSGAQDRDETIFEHKPFLVIADAFARAGIGSLRCDDRGTSESTGDFATADMADFVTDGVAMVKALEARADIDKKHIGALGHSQGGIIVGELAKAGDIDFGVLLAGPSLPGSEVSVQQNVEAIMAQGVSAEQAKSLETVLRSLFTGIADGLPAAELQTRLRAVAEGVIATKPPAEAVPLERIEAQFAPLMQNRWFVSWVKSKPAGVIAKSKVPVLALYGDKDTQVPGAAHAEFLKKAFDEAKKKNGEVELVPGVNHLFQQAKTGKVSEYDENEETMTPAVLERIVSWVAKVAK